MNKNIRPHIPTHPGFVLKDELQARRISQKRFSELSGISYTMFNEVVNGKRPVTADMALILEAALGINASLWNTLQSSYDLETARRDKKNESRMNAVKKAFRAACF